MSAREKGRNNDYVFQPKPGNRLINPWTPTPLSCYFRELGLLFLSPDSGCRSSTTQTRLLGELRGSLWNAEIQENTSCSPCQALGYLLWLPPLPPIIKRLEFVSPPDEHQLTNPVSAGASLVPSSSKCPSPLHQSVQVSSCRTLFPSQWLFWVNSAFTTLVPSFSWTKVRPTFPTARGRVSSDRKSQCWQGSGYELDLRVALSICHMCTPLSGVSQVPFIDHGGYQVRK